MNRNKSIEEILINIEDINNLINSVMKSSLFIISNTKNIKKLKNFLKYV